VDTFMFEGHDTTAAGLGWTIWCLATHPKMQERAYREVIEELGENRDGDIGREDMGKLVYLDRCIKEALRIYPPVPFVSRQLKRDFHLGDYSLPENSQVSISPFVVHRNESIYPNPLEYVPYRFLPEKEAKRNAYDYIPFSAGPRNCIGQKFAQFEEKIILAWLIRSFRFSSNKPFEARRFATEAILRPIDGIIVNVERR
ncbi:hypothetical protein PENTCL1PPCAC_3260, partial [Pristionchus entomophagus]